MLGTVCKQNKAVIVYFIIYFYISLLYGLWTIQEGRANDSVA